MKVPPLLIIQ